MWRGGSGTFSKVCPNEHEVKDVHDAIFVDITYEPLPAFAKVTSDENKVENIDHPIAVDISSLAWENVQGHIPQQFRSVP